MNKNLKKVISSIAALALSASCFTALAADFSDVAADNSYKAAIDELVALKIVNGYEDGTFKPENTITRAELVSMLVRIVPETKTETTISFSDINENDWFYEAAMKASSMGIVTRLSISSEPTLEYVVITTAIFRSISGIASIGSIERE